MTRSTQCGELDRKKKKQLIKQLALFAMETARNINDEDIVANLFSTPFSRLTFKEKLELIQSSFFVLVFNPIKCLHVLSIGLEKVSKLI